MSRILLVEDDPSILRGIADNLRFESHEVLAATDGDAGYRMLLDERPDLVILDLMLPKMSGYELCQRARREGISTPVIMLTARGDEADRVLGLDLGADDYLTKPFSVRELLARVRAVLRRPQSANNQGPDALRFADVLVDFRRYEASRGGHTVDLTRKEFGLLRALATRAGEVVRRDTLLDEVWGYEADVTTRTVDNHVASLRAKLEVNAAKPAHIITVHGVGYKWVA